MKELLLLTITLLLLIITFLVWNYKQVKRKRVTIEKEGIRTEAKIVEIKEYRQGYSAYKVAFTDSKGKEYKIVSDSFLETPKLKVNETIDIIYLRHDPKKWIIDQG